MRHLRDVREKLFGGSRAAAKDRASQNLLALSPDSRDTQGEAARAASARNSRGDFIPSAECGGSSL